MLWRESESASVRSTRARVASRDSQWCVDVVLRADGLDRAVYECSALTPPLSSSKSRRGRLVTRAKCPRGAEARAGASSHQHPQ